MNNKVKLDHKIKPISYDDEAITFNDGSYLFFNHMQDCCENNYAAIFLHWITRVFLNQSLIISSWKKVIGAGFVSMDLRSTATHSKTAIIQAQ